MAEIRDLEAALIRRQEAIGAAHEKRFELITSSEEAKRFRIEQAALLEQHQGIILGLAAFFSWVGGNPVTWKAPLVCDRPGWGTSISF